jgi:hypothetical protein
LGAALGIDSLARLSELMARALTMVRTFARRVDGEVRIDNEFVDYIARTSGLSRRFLAGNQDDPIIEYGTLLRFDLKDIP